MKVDIAIIGGGLAGLSLAIDLKKRGHSVAVIEKGNYPRHKVCGEYISMESHRYLHALCPALSDLNLPLVSRFKLSSTGKHEFNTKLDLGGFGISRYLLEDLLFKEAKFNGVVFLLNNKANAISHDVSNGSYTIATNAETIEATIVCNATGRKSNFETKDKTNQRIGNNYVGIKYHIRLERDPALIEIHNFNGGYCGISNIEEDKSCLCYIVNAEKLHHVKNSISELEQVFLFKNSHLKNIFTHAEFLFKEPVTISGINFLIKEPATDQSFFLGDSAGCIAPIAGNGMSMALRSASVLAQNIDDYFSDKLTKSQLDDGYNKFWNKEFSARIKLSRYLQKLSEISFLTNMTIGLFNMVPFIAKGLIRQTHGKDF